MKGVPDFQSATVARAISASPIFAKWSKTHCAEAQGISRVFHDLDKMINWNTLCEFVAKWQKFYCVISSWKVANCSV